MYQTLLTIFIFTDPCMHTQVYVSSFLWFAISCDSYTCGKRNKLKKKRKEPFKHSTCPYLSQVQLFVTSWTIQGASFLCPWNFPNKNSGVGCHFLLQGIFQTHASNPDLLQFLHWQVDSLPLRHLGSPIVTTLQSNCLFTLQR